MQYALAAVIDDLATLDVSSWSDTAIADEFIALRKSQDRLDAIAARLLVGVGDRLIPVGEGACSTPTWAQWRTGLRVREAKSLLDAGVACETMAIVAAAWSKGEISSSAARTIAAGIKPGHEDLYRQLEPHLVELAAAHEFRDLDTVIRYYRRCADDLDDIQPEERNGVYLAEVGDRWALKGDLDLLAGQIAKAALTAALDHDDSPDDDRDAGQRNAAALARIFESYLDRGDLPIEDGEKPHATIVIPWSMIIDGVPCRSSLASGDAGLSKHEIARVLCDANITRIIMGPDGQPLDVGRAYRSAPRWIRRAIAIRDGGCRYTGCQRPSRRCEAHHVHSWETGGITAISNLVLLCWFHHRVVHRPGWTNTFDGITYRVHNADGILIE